MSRFKKILAAETTTPQDASKRQPPAKNEGVAKSDRAASPPPAPHRADSDPWPILLALAAFVTAPGPAPVMLRGCLMWLRDMGCRVERVQGGCKLARGDLHEEEWDEVKQVLEPYRAQLKQILRWLYQGGVAIESEVLGEKVFLSVRDIAPHEVRGMVVYTPEEIRELSDADADTLRQVHAAKKAFGGRVVGGAA